MRDSEVGEKLKDEPSKGGELALAPASSLVRLREPVMPQAKRMKDGLMNTDKIGSPQLAIGDL